MWRVTDSSPRFVHRAETRGPDRDFSNRTKNARNKHRGAIGGKGCQVAADVGTIAGQPGPGDRFGSVTQPGR